MMALEKELETYRRELHNLLKEEDSAEYREDAWYHKTCWDEGVRQLNTAMKRAAEIARRFALPRVSTPHSEADHTNSF